MEDIDIFIIFAYINQILEVMITGILIGVLAGLAIFALVKWFAILAVFVLQGIVKVFMKVLDVVGGFVFKNFFRLLNWISDTVEEWIEKQRKSMLVGI